MDLVPKRRPGDYTALKPKQPGGDLASAGYEAQHVRPGEWVLVGYCAVKEPWALAAWERDVREGKKKTLGGTPGVFDATHELGCLVDGEFIPDESEGTRATHAAKFVAYVGTVTT